MLLSWNEKNIYIFFFLSLKSARNSVQNYVYKINIFFKICPWLNCFSGCLFTFLKYSTRKLSLKRLRMILVLKKTKFYFNMLNISFVKIFGHTAMTLALPIITNFYRAVIELYLLQCCVYLLTIIPWKITLNISKI